MFFSRVQPPGWLASSVPGRRNRKPRACALALPPGTVLPQDLLTSNGVRELLMDESQACPAACPAQLTPLAQHTPPEGPGTASAGSAGLRSSP